MQIFQLRARSLRHITHNSRLALGKQQCREFS